MTSVLAQAPARFSWLALPLLACVLFAWWVYRQALTPEEAQRRALPAKVDWNSVTDDPATLRTITWLGPPRFPGGSADAFGVRQLDEKFNVKIEPIFMDSLGYSSAKPLMFAAGDIPDISWDGNPDDVARDIYHGCIFPVPWEVIQKYAPHYFQLICQDAPMGWVYINHDGTNWGLPSIWSGGTFSDPGVWRKDWLKKVGIHKIPETLKEFHEAFRRFTFDDPDGDGKADTYGLTNTTVSWAEMFSEFFGAYGVLPFDWMVKNGKATWGGITPEAKETLAMLASWYREGIIDPDLVIDGVGGERRMREKFLNGRVGYASELGTYDEFDPTLPSALINVMPQLNPSAELAPAFLPIGPHGQKGVRNWGAAANTLVFGRTIANDPGKVIRILKMIDVQASNDPDTYILYSHGVRGKHWDFRVPDTGAPGTGLSSGIVTLPPYNNIQAYERGVLTVWGVENPEMEQHFMSTAKKQFLNTYQNPRDCLLDAIGRPDVVPSASQYLPDLINLQLTVYTDIIRGKEPLSAFEGFQREWLRRGGATLTAEATNFLAKKQDIFRQLHLDPSK